jgi:hypothetical protein
MYGAIRFVGQKKEKVVATKNVLKKNWNDLKKKSIMHTSQLNKLEKKTFIYFV